RLPPPARRRERAARRHRQASPHRRRRRLKAAKKGADRFPPIVACAVTRTAASEWSLEPDISVATTTTPMHENRFTTLKAPSGCWNRTNPTRSQPYERSKPEPSPPEPFLTRARQP